jgi:hypothetical protein
MIQKAPGAGGTYGIHPEIGNHTVADDYDLAILPAYFYDCSDIREVMSGSYSMSRYLVLNNIGAYNFSGKVPGTPGGADTGDIETQ